MRFIPTTIIINFIKARMKRYTSIALIGAAALNLAVMAQTCNVDCKKVCISEGLGDQCVSKCGCETLSNGVADKFAEQ